MGRDFFFFWSWNLRISDISVTEFANPPVEVGVQGFCLPHTHVVFTLLALVRLRGAIHEFWYYLSWASWASGTETSISPTVSEPCRVSAAGHFFLCVQERGVSSLSGSWFSFYLLFYLLRTVIWGLCGFYGVLLPGAYAQASGRWEF